MTWVQVKLWILIQQVWRGSESLHSTRNGADLGTALRVLRTGFPCVIQGDFRPPSVAVPLA